MFKNIFNGKNTNNYGDIIFKVNENIILYKTSVNKLRNAINCINWNKNRPYDKVRVNDIKSYYIEKNINVLPGIVYAWKNNESLEIYDGIHRILAAFEVGNIELLIQIYFTNNESLIIEDFKNINKAISVPTVYLEENNYIKKTVCENVANNLCEKYPRCVSASRNCQQQNFNRDNLIEMISKLQIDFEKKNVDNIIIQELVGLNFQAKDYVNTHKIVVPQKSHYNNFYLFFLQESFIKDKLQSAIMRDY
jgi:hypothetical protein